MKKNQGKYAFLFLLPYMSIFVFFRFGPSIAGLLISLTDWQLAGSPSFIGFDNFIRLFQDEYFYTSLLNTLKLILYTVPALLVLSLFLAMLLNQKMRFRNIARTVSIIPYVLIPAVVGIMWTWMFDNNFGLLNFYIQKLGGSSIYWLTDGDVALKSVSMVVIWIYVGYNMVLFLAGLQGIPKELYEAAEIDGSSKVQSFLYITLPMLNSVTSMVITLTLVNVVQMFDLIYVMTNGGPGTSTLTLVQYLYTSAFQNYELGYGSAIEVMILLLLILLYIVQNKFDKK